MRRLVLPLLSVVVLVAAAIAVLSYLSGDGPRARLVLAEVQGEVTVTGADGGRTAGAPGVVLEADSLVVTGQASRAYLEIGDEMEIRIDPESAVQVTAHEDEAVTLELEGGKLQATVRPGATSLRVGNRDRYVLTTDGAFEMGVGEDGTLLVEVSEGTAMTSGMELVPPQISAGEQATVAPDGSARVQPIPEELLLAVAWPEQHRTRDPMTRIAGETAPGARVRIDGGSRVVQVTAGTDGRFEAEVELVAGKSAVRVESVDQLGNTNAVEYWFEVDNRGPTIRRGGVEYGSTGPGG